MKKHNVITTDPHTFHRYPLSLADLYCRILRANAKTLTGLTLLMLLCFVQCNFAQVSTSGQTNRAGEQVEIANRKQQKNLFSSDTRDQLTRSLEAAYSYCPRTEIALGEVRRGSLASGNCVINNRFASEYTFRGNAGERVSISMVAAPGSHIDPFLYVSKNGRELASNDDSGTGLDARIGGSEHYFTLPEDGIYTIRATSYDTIGGNVPSSGDFLISLAPDLAMILAAQGNINVSTTSKKGSESIPAILGCTYSLSWSADNFATTFSSGRIYVRQGPGFEFFVRVNTQEGYSWSIVNNNPELLQVLSGAGPRNGTGDFSYIWPANAGAFRSGTIGINAFGDPTGNSVGTYQDGPVPPCIEASINLPQTLTNQSLTTSDCVVIGSYTKLFRFLGFTGQRISIVMTSPHFAPIIKLRRSNGAYIVGGFGTASPFPSEGYFTLPADDLYTIEATSSTHFPDVPGTGTFDLSLNSGGGGFFPIRGRVTEGSTNTGVPNVNINVQGVVTQLPVVTDSNGNYSFPPLSNGTYIVSASQSGQSFTPPSQSVTISDALPPPANFQRNYPPPTISNLNPAQTLVGAPVTVTITGSNFIAGATVLYGGQTIVPSSITPTSMQISLSAADVSTPGPRDVQVVNPSPGGGASNTLQFNVLIPVPVISSLNPSETLVGSPVVVSISGSKFVAGATVQYGGQTKTPTSVTATLIRFTLSAADVETPGARNVRVVNPGPGGGPSNIRQFNVLEPICPESEIVFGQAIPGILGGKACLVNQQRTDVYTFTGTLNQEITVSVSSDSIQPAVQLVDPNGQVVASEFGQTNARIPRLEFFRLQSSGTYKIRVSTLFTLGSYQVSLSLRPEMACDYTVSPATTYVAPEGGGSFTFDVLSDEGCPSVLATVGSESDHIRIRTNSGGRVTFSVAAHGGGAERTGTIIAGGKTHTIRQFGNSPPLNDFFAHAAELPSTRPSNERVQWRNNGASTEDGEPNHVEPANGQRSSAVEGHSVWYKWIAPSDGTFSFTTSGSNFDTVLAVYEGGAVNNLGLVARNDDTTNFDPTSKVNFIAYEGREYKIAVDGKNDSTGSIQLTYGPFRRLFRLYLQNFNGFTSNIEPENVVARRVGDGHEVRGTNISLGVWEFDLEADNANYVVTISGPDGITWEPSTYTISNSPGALNEMLANPDGGSSSGNGQNQPVYAAFSVPKYFTGWIEGITTLTETNALRISIASTGSSSAVQPVPCPNQDIGLVDGPNGKRAVYKCKIQPGSTHQVRPSASGKTFAVQVLELPATNSNSGPTSVAPYLIFATPTQTLPISGHVLANGQGLGGASIQLTSGTLTLTTVTNPDGKYEFQNLTSGLTYTLSATRPGYTFGTQPPVVLQGTGAIVDIVAMPCSYKFSPTFRAPANGGLREFTVTPNAGSENCGWSAQPAAGLPWIAINFGSSVGAGRVQYTLQANPGAARTGSILVGNQVVVINQRGSTEGSGASFDYDGDGRSDLSVFRPSNNHWYLLRERAGYTFLEWGAPGDRMAPADFDGDGRTDVAVFRPSNGIWYIVNVHTNTLQSIAWGESGDAPIPSDQDGDGKADLVVYRESNNTWYTRQSSNNVMLAKQFGTAGDRPVIGDFDGDGTGDIAVFRPSNNSWYLQMSTAGFATRTWGEAGDVPVAADYDGDGATDVAVFRPSDGRWYYIRSSGGLNVTSPWGQTGDIAAPGDFDGDGKADPTVFRPSTGVWYIFKTSEGINIQQFGEAGDVPTQGAYIYPSLP